MFKKLVDFATPDAFAELKKRSAACLNSGSNMICCETQVMVTVKVDATTPLAIAIKEDHAYSSHKNFKFFDTKNCGVDKSPADKVANGEFKNFFQGLVKTNGEIHRSRCRFAAPAMGGSHRLSKFR